MEIGHIGHDRHQFHPKPFAGGLISATLIGLSYLFWAQNATTDIEPH